MLTGTDTKKSQEKLTFSRQKKGAAGHDKNFLNSNYAIPAKHYRKNKNYPTPIYGSKG